MNTPSRTYLHLPYGRFLVRVAIVVALLLAFTAALCMVEQRRTQGEMGAILTGFFSDQVLRNVQDSGAGRKAQIVLLLKPQDAWQSNQYRRTLLFDGRSFFSQSSRTTRASFFVSNVFSTDLQTELHLPGGAQSFFIPRKEVQETNGKDFEARFPNNLGYFVVSHAGLNPSKTEAILCIDHFCGGLCGGGGYFLMRKINGVWHVVDQHLTWIS